MRHLRALVLGLTLAVLATAAPPMDGPSVCEASPRKRKRGTKVKYVVVPGDTLAGIAKKHGVTPRQIRGWNRLKNNIIVANQKLVIYAKKLPKIQSKRFHRVKAGDTFGSISKKYKMDVGDLISWNPHLDPRRLRTGDKVSFYVEVERPETSKKFQNTAYRTFVKHAVQLPKGKGYKVRNASRAWGTEMLVDVLRHGLGATKRKYRRAANLVVGDLSKKKGGFLPPHRSHRDGRDADVAYYIKGNKDVEWRFIRATPKTLDAAKTWFLFHTFLKTGKVKYIFVNYELQKPLYDYARSKGVSKKYLDRVFQYPKGRGSKGIIRHSRGHDNHFHIRVECAKGVTRGCR